jgi:SAM-dependent methyltransferase
MDIKDLKKKWEYLADNDPMWAILSDGDKKGNRWNTDEFFEIGRKDAAGYMAYIKPFVPSLHCGKGLDFGCGVGRLTQAHAEYFDEMTGVDISEKMITLARAYNKFGARVNYITNPNSDLSIFDSDSFDYIISHIVLQHVPAAIHVKYVKEFVRVLKKGGACLFQLPEPFDASWGHDVLTDENKGGLDMYGSTREDIVKILTGDGAKILEVVDDGSCGPGHVSNRYLFTK